MRTHYVIYHKHLPVETFNIFKMRVITLKRKSLLSTQEFQFLSEEELDAYEQSNPHPDGKRWCVAEQTIGNYYWMSNFIVRDMDILRKFGRLDFDLPVLT